MPPYGLYSLADTPEELLNRGYGYGTNIPLGQLSEAERNIIFTQYDPAFGNLNTDFGYFGAPYTGARPFQNAGFLRADRQFGLGFDADIEKPSFGGSMQYEPFSVFEREADFINAPQDYYGGVSQLDLDRFQGIGSLGRNDADVEQVEFLGSQPNRFQQGIGKLFELAQRFSPVAAIARGIGAIRDRMDTRQAIQRDIDRDPQGTINQTTSARITNMQPSDRDRARGRQESRRSRDLGSMRGGVGRSRSSSRGSSSYSQASQNRKR
jgi:hypothetical protein